MKTIAYQGALGAFSYITALKEFGEGTFIALRTFKDVFELVDSGKADYAVVPIENSLAGSIYENYDLLNSYDMQIVGERYTKVGHCLLAIPALQKEGALQKITKVLSHPKALEQCSCFFQEHPWIEAVVSTNTAAAASEVSAMGNPAYAAIASETAAQFYGLEILKKGLEDDPENYTRFVTIAKTGKTDHDADKCSLLLTLKHIPGALADMLKLFADGDINVTKIESRPLRGRPFEYLFYVDLEFIGKRQQDVEQLLQQLWSKVQTLKILGFYKSEDLHG